VASPHEHSTLRTRREERRRTFSSRTSLSLDSGSRHEAKRNAGKPSPHYGAPISGLSYCVTLFGAGISIWHSRGSAAIVRRVRRRAAGAWLRSNWGHVAQAAAAAPLGR
jgi:hypothetical protein